jgi:hypothetical protein
MLFNLVPFALSLSKGIEYAPFDRLRANGLFQLDVLCLSGSVYFFAMPHL